MNYSILTVKEILEVVKDKTRPERYALFDNNYRKLPNKDLFKVYLNDAIYFEMARMNKIKEFIK